MFLEKRLRLVALLTEAAELEHALSCQYLYAGFTLKNEAGDGVSYEEAEYLRRWKGEMMLIARQEMEHLGLVSNLLTAIGEAPYFGRPDFPTPKRYYPIHLRCELTSFSARALERFVRFEWPANLTLEQQQFAQQIGVDPAANDVSSIARMYGEIRALFQELGAKPKDLFVGPGSAQQSNATIIPVPLRGIQLAPGTAFYNVLVQPVADLKSALAAVDQIMVEGEGSPGDRAQSHFGRFRKMHAELHDVRARNPKFEPARVTIDNPRTAYPDDDATPSTITVDATNRVSMLFDLGYSTMCLMLVRFFAHSDETAAELAALQGTAFFPLMTNFIRPVGEILTQLPARQDDTSLFAGPSFRFARSITFLPHKKGAWRVIHEQLKLLERWGKELSENPALPSDVRTRLELIYENLGRMKMNFGAAMGIAPGGE